MRSEEEIKQAIEKYGDMIQKICFIHMKQQCDVDDIFQTVFLRYAKGPLFESDEHEKAWFIRVTMNACKDVFKSWFHRYIDLSSTIDDMSDENSSLSYSQTSDLMQAVLSLPTHYRQVIYLFYYEGYKVKEIADILHKKENTIHTWLKRSKEQLKDILGGDYLE